MNKSIIEVLNGFPKNTDARRPKGNVCICNIHGAWWLDGKDGYGNWYGSLTDLMRKWHIEIIKFDARKGEIKCRSTSMQFNQIMYATHTRQKIKLIGGFMKTTSNTATEFEARTRGERNLKGLLLDIKILKKQGIVESYKRMDSGTGYTLNVAPAYSVQYAARCLKTINSL